ncbi:hypothetical protein J5N97_019601 [Dioscorea zingiberensis]|uniref:Uncharacterized protein n=1 Tax=Dioscorea zingiberensis TaxID=325984 RepID=A0A9D5HCV8_9LILI|nr:hypothetical protein J5N97_019601 [Dioscorea zingiberensis]
MAPAASGQQDLPLNENDSQDMVLFEVLREASAMAVAADVGGALGMRRGEQSERAEKKHYRGIWIHLIVGNLLGFWLLEIGSLFVKVALMTPIEKLAIAASDSPLRSVSPFTPFLMLLICT